MNSDHTAETQITHLAPCALIFDTKVCILFEKTKFVLNLW